VTITSRQFDEPHGFLYDGAYSATFIFQGLSPILLISNTPALHPRNQYQGHRDFSAGLGKGLNVKFEQKIENGPATPWSNRGYPG
jgi:hypothetical protein